MALVLIILRNQNEHCISNLGSYANRLENVGVHQNKHDLTLAAVAQLLCKNGGTCFLE